MIKMYSNASEAFGGTRLGNVVCAFDGSGNSGYMADNVFTFAQCSGSNLTLQDNVTTKITAVDCNLTLRECETCIYRGKEDNLVIRNTKNVAVRGLKNRGNISECTRVTVMGSGLNLRMEKCRNFLVHGSSGRVEASGVVNAKVEGHGPNVKLKDVQSVLLRKSLPSETGCVGVVLVQPEIQLQSERRESLRLKKAKMEATTSATTDLAHGSSTTDDANFTYKIFYTDKVEVEGDTFNLEGFVFTVVDLKRSKKSKSSKLRLRLEKDRMEWDEGTELDVMNLRSIYCRITKTYQGKRHCIGFDGAVVELL